MSQYARYPAVRTLAPQPAPLGICASKYDPLLAAYICQELAAGRSLRSLCRTDPSMPTEKTVWNWTRAHPEFAHAKALAMATARAAARARHDERRAAREARWAARAATSTDGRSRIRRGSPYTPEIREAFCERVCLGEPVYKVCRDPAMPSLGTIYNWLRADPEFRAAYQRAKEVAFDFVVETTVEGAVWAPPGRGSGDASLRALARLEAQAHGRCGRLAPRTFGRGWYGVLDPGD